MKNLPFKSSMNLSNIFKKIPVLVTVLVSCQSLSAQFGDVNYAYVGLNLQSGSITNAYMMTTMHSDKFSGPSALFGVESYNEGGSWSNFSADGLFQAVVSIAKPTFVPKLKDYEANAQQTNSDRGVYLLSTPLLKWGGAFSPGKQDLIGPTFQFGLEGISLLQMNEKGKGKKLSNAIGGQTDGVLTYGTGLQVFNPLRSIPLFRNSRLSFNIDWMLAREADEKFRVSGRKRYTLEMVTMLGRRGYIKAFYQNVDYRNSFFLNNPVQGGEAIPVSSKMSVVGLGIGLNWLQYGDN